MNHLAETRRILKLRLETMLHHIPVIVTGIDFLTNNNRASTMMQCVRLVEQADLFVVLLGDRIGRYNEIGFTGTEIEIQTALRMDIPKIIADLSPGMASVKPHAGYGRDPEVNYLLEWLKSSNGSYFQSLKATNQAELIRVLARQIEKDHAMLRQNNRKTYFSSIGTHLSDESIGYYISDIDELTFDFHYRQLLADYALYVNYGDPSKLLHERFYVYFYIRNRLSSESNYFSEPARHYSFLEQAAKALQIFAECFNFKYYTGKINKDALWCAQTASYIYMITGKLEQYKASLIPHIHTLFTMSSRFRQRFGRQDPNNEFIKNRLLTRALHYSDYLYYLDQRSAQQSSYLPDNGYRAYIIRDLGAPDEAVKLLRRMVQRRPEADVHSFYLLSQLTYTQSISTDQTGFKKNLELLEGYFSNKTGGNVESLLGRTIMDIYFSMGEKTKGLALFDELLVTANELQSEGEKQKLKKSRNDFLRKVN